MEWVIRNVVDPDFHLVSAEGLIPSARRATAQERSLQFKRAQAEYEKALGPLDSLSDEAWGSEALSLKRAELYDLQEALAKSIKTSRKGDQGPLFGELPVVQTPESMAARPQGLPVEMGTVTYEGDRAIIGREGYQQSSNMSPAKTFDEALNSVEDPRTITRISLDEKALLGESDEFVIDLKRGSSIEQAIAGLKKTFKGDLPDDPILYVEHRSRTFNPDAPKAKSHPVRESDLAFYEFREVDEIDVGFRRGPGDRFDPSIKQDVEGDWYVARHEKSYDDGAYEVTEEIQAWADDLKNAMEEIRADLEYYGVLTKDQVGHNPLTGYFPRDYRAELKSHAESLIPDNIYSASGKSSPEKARAPKFGTPLGRAGEKIKEVVSENIREPVLKAQDVLGDYAGVMSTKAAQHQVNIAYLDQFGIKKERFMELVKTESFGGRVKDIITDPRAGTHLRYGKPESGRLSLAAESIFPGINAIVKRQPITRELRHGPEAARAAEAAMAQRPLGSYAAKLSDEVEAKFRVPMAFRRTEAGEDVIFLDPEKISEAFKKEAWKHPKVEGVRPIERKIASESELEDFLVAHERAHVKSRRKPGESRADYENRTNDAALVELDRVYAERKIDAEIREFPHLESYSISHQRDYLQEKAAGELREILTEKRANKEWERYRRLARDSNGNELSGGKYKIAENAQGEEVLIPAKVANWAKQFGHGDDVWDMPYIKAITKRTGYLGSTMRGAAMVERSIRRNFARLLLLPVPGYHIINAPTDAVQLYAKLGIHDLGNKMKSAHTLLKNPGNFSLTVKVGKAKKTYTGRELLRGARENEIGLGSLARLDLIASDMPMKKQLELVALRSSGKAFKLSDWKEFLTNPVLNTRSARTKAGKYNLISGGEALAAYWSDIVQMTGFIHQVSKGDSFAIAAEKSLKAVIPYTEQDTLLKAIKTVMPIVTWAVKSPKATAAAFITNPRPAIAAMRYGEFLEGKARKESGENYALPFWMQEVGNYRRVPETYKQVYSLARKLVGGTELTADEQLYVKQRAVPLFEAWQMWLSMGQNVFSSRDNPIDPLLFQLGPTWRMLYEWAADRDLFTKKSYEDIYELDRPFPDGTAIPGVPSFTEENISILGNTASPAQQGWAAKNWGLFGALPEAVPGQKMLFSRVGMSMLNTANYYAQEGEAPPIVLGGTRPRAGGDKGPNVLAHNILGWMTGVGTSVLTPGKGLSALEMGQNRAREIKDQRDARARYEEMMRLIEEEGARLEAAREKAR